MNEYARYWRFFWPLALNGLVLLLGQQAYNGVLARYPEPERAIAVYACALGVYYFFDIGTAFMSNMVTVYAHSPQARARVLRFCLAVGVAFMLPVLAMGATAPGHALLALMYRMDAGMLAEVAQYLTLLSGMILLHVMHHYLNGLLIQSEQTWTVSLIGTGGVAISVAIAVFALNAGWSPVWALCTAEWATGLFKLLALAVRWRAIAWRYPGDARPAPGWGELLNFFWPVCVSGMTFGLSRPLMFVFVARVEGAVAIIAAMRVAMDFLMLYQAVVNQFRHFFATFGLDQLRQKRIFMAMVAAGLIGAMATVLATPLSDWFFATALGLGEELHRQARYMSVILLVVPAILMIRNYYHGILIVWKRTTAMAVGSAARVLAITATGAGLLAAGLLDERTAILGMIAGFLAEMMLAWISVRRLRAA